MYRVHLAAMDLLDTWISRVQTDHAAAAYVPPELWTQPAFFEPLFTVADDVLRYIPRACRYVDVCVAAVSAAATANHYPLIHVPEDLLRQVKFRLAVRRNGMCLEFVPTAWHTEALCLDAVRQNPAAYQFARGVGGTSLAVAAAAISGDWQNIRLIRQSTLTEELCLLAVKGHIAAFELVPIHLRTAAVCEVAYAKFEQNKEE